MCTCFRKKEDGITKLLKPKTVCDHLSGWGWGNKAEREESRSDKQEQTKRFYHL